jgi:hypothetical protein
MEEKNRRMIHAIRTEDVYNHRLGGAAIRYKAPLGGRAPIYRPGRMNAWASRAASATKVPDGLKQAHVGGVCCATLLG